MTEQLGISVKEAAKVLGVTPRTVYNLLYAGAFPYFRIGRGRLGDIRIRYDVLKTWIDQNTSQYGVADRVAMPVRKSSSWGK